MIYLCYKIMKLLIFYLCFSIEAEFTTSLNTTNSSINFLSQSDTEDFNKFLLKYVKKYLSRNMDFEENLAEIIMGSQFEFPENDEIIQDSYIKEFPMSSPFGNETFVPLSLLKIKIWYDDGFLDHPDIKTTDKAEIYIRTTLEYVQHNFCLSTLGTRLQVEVRALQKIY